MFFLRKSTLERLPVVMSGVRMGERALPIGIADPALQRAFPHAHAAHDDGQAFERRLAQKEHQLAILAFTNPDEVSFVAVV